MALVSNCCGTKPITEFNEYGVCLTCKEDCEYITQEEYNKMHKCERCNGDGCIEQNIPGYEGVPEQDVMIQCPECDGTGIATDEYNYVTDEMLNGFYADHPDYLKAENAKHNKE